MTNFKVLINDIENKKEKSLLKIHIIHFVRNIKIFLNFSAGLPQKIHEIKQ